MTSIVSSASTSSPFCSGSLKVPGALGTGVVEEGAGVGEGVGSGVALGVAAGVVGMGVAAGVGSGVS
jgi:hypothetical protein